MLINSCFKSPATANLTSCAPAALGEEKSKEEGSCSGKPNRTNADGKIDVINKTGI